MKTITPSEFILTDRHDRGSMSGLMGMTFAEAVEVHYARYIGPCLFCGFHDKRHRVVDALRDFYRASDEIEEIQKDYDWLPLEAVQAICLATDEEVASFWNRAR